MANYVAPANNGTTGTMDGSTAIGSLNYADNYQRTLEQNFPYVLNFGALYATPNNGRYRWVDSKTIEIPSISTTGRIDADRVCTEKLSELLGKQDTQEREKVVNTCTSS